MDRKKTHSRITNCSLIAILLFFTFTLKAATHKLGRITQAIGEISYLNFSPPHHRVTEVKTDSQLLTNGSYLTKDAAFFTVQLFDGNWLRVSPRSKISVEFDPSSKVLTIHLFTGSLKALFSSKISNQKLEKLVVKSAGANFETSEGKFTVSRNPLSDLSSVYVEKGAVVTTQYVLNEKKDMEIVHAKETTFINDRDNDIRPPRAMTDKEIKFLHPSHYLKDSKSQM